MDSEADDKIVEDVDCVKEIVQRNLLLFQKRYILTENTLSKDEEIPLLSAKISVLDLALLSNGQEDEHKLLDEACKHWGFFLVINHGIPKEIPEDLKTAASKFFNLPLIEKIKYKFDPLSGGHGRPYPVSEDQTVDWSDTLMLRISPVQAKNLELWPEALRYVLQPNHSPKNKIKLAIIRKEKMEVDFDPLKQMLDNLQQGRQYNKVNYGEHLMNSLGRKLVGKEYIANNASKEEI